MTTASTTTSARPCRGRRDEVGSMAPILPFIFLIIFAVGGMVIDGGYALAADRKAMGEAEQAARVGADALDEGALRDGITVVNNRRARLAAQAYLAEVGSTGTVEISGGVVTVTVMRDQDTTLLGAFGLDSIHVTATASATSINEDGLTP
jgi:Flp pilus assembly protein TadG